MKEKEQESLTHSSRLLKSWVLVYGCDQMVKQMVQENSNKIVQKLKEDLETDER